MATNHQFWAPRRYGRGDIPRNVHLWATVRSSMLRDLDLDLGSGLGHVNIHSTCRTTRMLNHVTVVSRTTEIWPFYIDIGQSLKSRDSFPRWKFKNRAPTSCSPGPILWPPSISFELHTEMAEEIDLEKCTFRNFGSSVTLTLDRVEVTLVRICGRGLSTHQIRWKSEKLFVDVQMDVRTHLSSNLLGHRRGDDLKIKKKDYKKSGNTEH